jgi:hypothetical protein
MIEPDHIYQNELAGWERIEIADGGSPRILLNQSKDESGLVLQSRNRGLTMGLSQAYISLTKLLSISDLLP